MLFSELNKLAEDNPVNLQVEDNPVNLQVIEDIRFLRELQTELREIENPSDKSILTYLNGVKDKIIEVAKRNNINIEELVKANSAEIDLEKPL